MKAENQYAEAREVFREMFADGELSRSEYAALEQNPGPIWEYIMSQIKEETTPNPQG